MKLEPWEAYHIHAMYGAPWENSTIRNSAHRKPSTAFFNSSCGTAIAEAAKVQHISIFSIHEDVLHF
jgi:hypothetical protein